MGVVTPPDVVYLSALAPSVAPSRVGTDTPGRWRKELLRVGSWVHPRDPARKLMVTPDVLRRLVENFQTGRRDRTPVQKDHSDWAGTVGDVEDLIIEGDRLIATLSITDDGAAHAIATKKVTGVSAAFTEDYTDKATGEKVGPTLIHAALTNSPYIGGLGGYAALSETDALIYLDDTDEDDAPDDDDGNVDNTTALLLRNPDLSEADAREVTRLAKIAAQRLPARHPVDHDTDGEDPAEAAARDHAHHTLTKDEREVRDEIERKTKMQHPTITDTELDEVARLTALARSRQ